MDELEEQLEGLPYRELQSRCREAGLRATGKAEELLQRLLDHAAAGGNVPSSPAPTTARKATRARSEMGTAKTPRTTRKSAAAATAPTAEADAAERTPVVNKAALLRAAAGTPLPSARRPVDEEEEDGDEAPGSRRRSAGSAQRASLTGGSPGKSGRRSSAPPPPPSATTAGLATPVFWLVMLTALGAGLAALVVPYCQQRDCPELLHNLPELAADAAAEGYGAARAHALAAADALRDRWQELLARIRTDTPVPVGKPACQFDAAAALHAVMPEDDAYAALKATATLILGSQGREPADKPAVALLACAGDAECHGAVGALDAAAPDAPRCMLHLDARHLGDDRGALQSQLAEFLTAAPTGIVVLRRIDQLSPELLPVLINALSEGGSFQQDGQAVPTTGSTFLLTAVMPGEVFAYLGDEIKFKQEAKTALVVDFAMRAADRDAAKSQASALRRRVDLVIPVAAGPAVEEAVPISAADADAAAAA